MSAENNDHVHMMRKLGDGVSVDDDDLHVLLAKIAEAVLQKPGTHYPTARKNLVAHIDAKLAQARAAGAERAVPEGWKRATGDAAASGWAWDYQWLESLREQVGGDAGMEEIDALLTVLAAAPSPTAAKEGGEA